MANNGLRTQYPYGAGDALSPRPLYDFPSPSSNYPSGIGGTSPGFYPMAYQSTPRFASSAFIPPPDVFVEGRKGLGVDIDVGPETPREYRPRRSTVLQSDPVAMHLLVETALGDSALFDVLSVEEVESMKQEQRALDTKLNAARKKLEAESKIRDAMQSLNRLNSKGDKGHRRGPSSRGNNAVKDTAKSDAELEASNRKVEDLTRELLEIESRMRLIDMQLLMHTAGVLQLTHNGPNKRNQKSSISNGVGQRPDSPASIDTYENSRTFGRDENDFDERSLYRSPENLDSLMNALQNGTHHSTEEVERQSEALSATARRLEDLNDRMRELIVQANPERNQDYAVPPRAPGGTPDASTVDMQLDFLDQGLRDVSAEHANGHSGGSMTEVEDRLAGINNQLYAMLSKAEEQPAPPPTASGNSAEEQLNYLEQSFYDIQQVQYALDEKMDNLQQRSDSMAQELEEVRSRPAGNQDSQYEATLTNLWSVILAGEEEARQKKRQRRELLATDPDADEEVSPDEDYDPNEPFTLTAFSSKVQWLCRRATSLKEKQTILLRQIKQQRELNSRSDAQKEEQFDELKERVLSARNEKFSMEKELERAMSLLKQTETDQHKNESSGRALEDAEARIDQLEVRIEETTAALQTATAEREAAEARHAEVAQALSTKEDELRDLEGEVVRLTTEATIARAELEGAYGSRAERAAENAANPALKKEIEDLAAKNASLLHEIETLGKASDVASKSEAEARDSERNLKQELTAMAADYEALTRDSIQNEKDRDVLEASIDKLRDEKEALELELSDERVKLLGVRSPATPSGGVPGMESTSIRMLREDFRKMMRDRTSEGLRALRSEQEERRKLEALVRTLRKDASPQKSNLSKQMTL